MWLIVIFASISHCDYASPCEFESLMKLVLKGLSIYRLSSETSTCWISALYHKAWDEPMKWGIVVIALETMMDKIPGCQWRLLGPEFNIDFPMTGIKNDFAGGWWLLYSNLSIHKFIIFVSIMYENPFIDLLLILNSFNLYIC